MPLSPSSTITLCEVSEKIQHKWLEDTKLPSELVKDFGFIPIPKHLRYDPRRPFRFGTALYIYFAFASTFAVGNLYYCQPLLIQISRSFNVSISEVSRIPILIQAGYAAGLILISPLGDVLRQRQLILCLVVISTSLTIGLAVTNNLIVFQSLSFLVGVVSVTPQVLLSLAADLAPEKRRASTISVVVSGLLFGIVISRVLAGIIAEFRTWREVYYFAFTVQCMVLAGCCFTVPDCPPKNTNLTYFHTLWTMAKLAVTEPVLIQGCLLNMGAGACFSNYWVTLTFLLGGPPYNYPTLIIGLFGLIGVAGVSTGPLGGHFIDRMVPWYASLISILMLMVFQAIRAGAGGIHVVAVVIATFGVDVFRQSLQVSVTTAIFGISGPARARINAVATLSNFIGQVIGTSVGTHLFTRFGRRAAAGFPLALCGWMLFVLLIRGPHCKRLTWFGYEGGVEVRKFEVDQQKCLNGEGEDLAKSKGPF